MFKVGICGNFNDCLSLSDGQTIKTQNVFLALKSQIGLDDIMTINTCGGIRKVFSIIIGLIELFIKCNNIIIMPAKNGLKLIAPLSYLINKVIHKKRKVFYIVIGGWLPEFCAKHSFILTVIRSFDGIFVETDNMRILLEEMGLKNVYIMPNFKYYLDIVSIDNSEFGEIRFCTFSRVMKEKGIEEAIKAVRTINQEYNQKVYLDIYGNIEQKYKDKFDIIQKNNPSYIKYKGLVKHDESISVLKNYSALLFPTYYEGEGFAGTLIDAMKAGLPVICSDWKYNTEIIKDGYNGFVFQAKSTDALVDAIIRYLKCDNLQTIKKNCRTLSKDYEPEKVIRILLDKMG